jgi:hypothetical protein
MGNAWKHLTTLVDGERYYINGLNIWDHKWISTGERISVQDPVYGQVYSMRVYEIISGIETIRFAAGEFSNCIFGIYQES